MNASVSHTMPEARLEDVRNFREVDGKLATCGQPTEAQLAAARSAGVEVVINLALQDDPRYSLPDERGTVEALGMAYRAAECRRERLIRRRQAYLPFDTVPIA